MDDALPTEYVLGSLGDAIAAARALQEKGYGLKEAVAVDGGGYQFTYQRPDEATSQILLIPATLQDEPDFVIRRRGSEPAWQRGVGGESFSSPQEAAEYLETRGLSPDDYEVGPLINVLQPF